LEPKELAMNRDPRSRDGLGPSIGLLKHAFTLLEILIVISIIALLLAIFLPSFNRARKQTRRTICKGYQYQLTFADSCGAARLNLDAFDCGCYGEAGRDLDAFKLPPDVTEDEFRRQLEADVFKSCGSRPVPNQ
jgi:prepilin-type N-terminal cleavage/methylation domain-containing protein